MKNKKTRKYEMCRFARSIGQAVVLVQPNCPYGRLIAGELAAIKRDCETCRYYEERGKVNE